MLDRLNSFGYCIFIYFFFLLQEGIFVFFTFMLYFGDFFYFS